MKYPSTTSARNTQNLIEDQVKAALGELNTSGPHSFASLTRQDGSYVQVAGGKQKCLIEKRNTIDSTHWRAYQTEPALPSDEIQVLNFGGGQMTMTVDEVFSIDVVVSVWRGVL